MLTDTELKTIGVEALIARLGRVEAERFIALSAREPFDYTIWRQRLFEGMTVEEISRQAMEEWRKNNPDHDPKS